MAINISNRNFSKDTRNCKRNHETLSDETALRDEILKLKRQVMVLRRTNEQNLVKFRKYEDEAKRKDREIEQLMDPRKNADVTKILSTKGAAILMTLKDQNNALIQMVLNKDVQIRRLLAEMKMSKLYAPARKNVSYKEAIARLKSLLLKSQEKLKENLDKENEAKSAWANEGSFLELSSSSEQSSPRDSEELRLVIRGLEAHLKHSNDLLNKKDQEISLLTDELSFLKKLLQHKASKHKNFDCDSTERHEYSITDAHSVPQTTVSYIIPQTSKISGTELLQFFQKSPDIESKILSSSAPASSTRLPSSDIVSKHKSLSKVADDENWKDSKIEQAKVTKTDATLLHEIAVGEDSNEAGVTSNLEKIEKVRDRKKILTKRREPKKRIPKKLTKKKKFYENKGKKRNAFVLEASESEKNEKEENGQMISEIFKIMNSKENEDMSAKTGDIFSKTENSEFDDLRSPRAEIEEFKGSQKDRANFTVNRDSDGGYKEPEGCDSNDRSIKDLLMASISGGSTENSPVREKNSRTSGEEAKPINFRSEIYRQSFDSNSESENGYSTKRQVQQVQVEVQIDSILTQNDGDESENSTGESNNQREFSETGDDNCAPDDCDNNNDDDNDVITR